MAKEMPIWKQVAKDRFLEEYFKYQNNTGKSNEKIAKELDISASTLKDTIYGPYFNADFVIAFCLKYKTVDINYIYAGINDEPGEANENLQASNRSFTTFKHSRDCHILDDDAFMGTFYGYCRNTQYHNMIDSFILDIHKNFKNDVEATLVLSTHNQKSEVTKKILYGKPMHLEPNIIYIVLQSNSGDDMFIMSYNYFKINSGKKLYCRYGSLMTPCRATNRYPQLQSFLLLDNPVLPENIHYVDGFLNLTQDKIIVPADLYDSSTSGLLVNDDNVKAFFDMCKDLQYNKEEYYCFSEKVLLALGEANGVDYDTTAATIMTLKKNSINPKVVDFPNNKTYSKFFAGLTKEESSYPNY